MIDKDAVQQKIQAQLEDVKAQGETAFGDVKATVEGVVGDISNTLKSITARFK